MSNVDKATRILNRASTDEFVSLPDYEKSKIIDDFVKIPFNQKPTSFRLATHQEISKFIVGLNQNLKRVLREAYRINAINITESSNNNLIDSDIIITCDTGEINGELKFGEETNSNIGNGSMDSIFDFKSINFKQIAKRIQLSQRDFVIKNNNYDEEKVLENLDSSLANIVIELKKAIDNGDVKIDSQKMNHLLTTSGSPEKSSTNRTIKVRVDYNPLIEKQIKPMDDLNAAGEWKITSLKKPENSSRIEIKCTNGIISCKFLLNWKNNHRVKGRAEKVPAKWGLGTSNWNVWAD